MKRASQISEVINAFSLEPVKHNQMEEFYCDNTMEIRMNDKYSSPMDDIYDLCCRGGDEAVLLLGHKGCGKSTELNRVSLKLEQDGYPVKTMICTEDLDLLKLVYSDLLILMGDALLTIAKEHGCEIEKEILDEIELFWQEATETQTYVDTTESGTETGIKVETPKVLSGLLSVFANIKANLKYNEENRIEYRKKISARSSEWIELLKKIANKIREKTEGKSPILIFEDLDKLNPEDAWEVFYNYAAILSGMSFPVIYTFPIGLSYDTRFATLDSYFVTKTLPMIKISTIDGQIFDAGIAVIKEIVEKRANLHLFEQNVLEELIRKTGGSLRDLFKAIIASATRANRRKAEQISLQDAKYALEMLKTELTRRIELCDYAFLKNIYSGDKETIEDKEILLKMLQASVVLEYNGKRWHNVHPLVIEFLETRGKK